MDEDAARWVLTQLIARRPRYLLYEAYFHGVHRLAFATSRFRNAFGDLFREFADNVCSTVVDSLTDRLQVRGFEDTGPGASAAAASVAAATGVWDENEMDVEAGYIHEDAAVYGDAYTVTWLAEDGAPTIYRQSPTEMVVRYSKDRPGRALYAGKCWRTDDGRARLTLYYPDRLEHYVTRGQVRTIPDKPGRFVPYTEEGPPVVTHAWGRVPVAHYANGAARGRPGRSELAPVIPLQDALNKAIADMLVGMEFISFPQRWATGIEEEVDEVTGRPVAPFRPGVERLWTAADKDARFGQFDGADLTQHLAVQDNLRQEVGRVTGTPAHVFALTGEWPSGVALVMAEGRQVKKARDRQRSFGRRHADSVTLALAMNGDSTAGKLRTVWEPAETRQEREEAETLVLRKQLGLSEQTALREMGYTDDEVDRIREERREEREAAAAMIAAGGLG